MNHLPSTSAAIHGLGDASPWVRRWSPLLRPGGTVLDIACGHGRHMRYLASLGHPVTGIDRSPEAVAAVSGLGEAVQADIESAPWPLLHNGQPRRFDAVIVTNYLWRALFPLMLESLAPGGVLIYETFASGNETVGKPSRPDFLLGHGELLEAFSALRIVAYEDGFIAEPARFVQRLAAVRPPAAPPTQPVRYPI